MAADVTVRTSLLEHRLLAGSRAAVPRSSRRAFDDALDVRAFYDAKTLEQQQRHLKYHDAAYNLEPNVKESPGGLRDLQTVLWIARAAGLGRTWRELARARPHDAARGARGRAAGALHRRAARAPALPRRPPRGPAGVRPAGRARRAARACTTRRPKRASEQLMQRYYRAAKLVRQVNTILLQNLHARLYPGRHASRCRSTREFQRDRRAARRARRARCSSGGPRAMLDAFLHAAAPSRAEGHVGAHAARAVARPAPHRRARSAAIPANRARFMRCCASRAACTHELRRMNLYGILGHYLPAFGRIVGQMQHDLFHVYTVDEHILMVIRNLRRFTEAQHAHEYPLCSRLIADFERKEVLYLAGLFHDIAKGRGGDHSTLGARDARRFCREHGLPTRGRASSSRGWSQNHLAMSSTAQKQDISDPDVVAAFAEQGRRPSGA